MGKAAIFHSISILFKWGWGREVKTGSEEAVTEGGRCDIDDCVPQSGGKDEPGPSDGCPEPHHHPVPTLTLGSTHPWLKPSLVQPEVKEKISHTDPVFVKIFLFCLL